MTQMRNLEFEYDLARVRELTPDFVPCPVERKEHHYSLGIGLSSRCNFRCPMCYYHGDGNAPGHSDMPLPALKALLAPLPRLASILIGLEGEPFCHPQFFDALDIMAANTDSLSIVSNGSLINHEICKRLSDYPIGSFALSIDAGDEANYRRFRKGGELRTFKKNGATLAEQLGNVVCLHAVIFAENLDSLPLLPDVAAEMGIRWISLQLFHPTAGALHRNVHPAEKEKMKEGIKRIIDSAEKRNIILLFDHKFSEKEIIDYLTNISKKCKYIKIENKKSLSCQQILNFTSILSSGKIFPCCGDFSPSSIYSISFDGIFNHEYLQRLRFLHIKKNVYIFPCKSCLHIHEAHNVTKIYPYTT